MKTIEDAFAALLSRQPTDKERQWLMRARDALGLRDNDALWLLLMVLGHYETLYGRFPALIAQAAARAMENVKAAAESEFKAAASRTSAELAKSVARVAHDIAGRVASAKRWQSVGWALAISAAVFVGVGASMYREGVASGNAAGQSEGYARARDEKAAEAWANTPEGQLGFRLAKAGSLRDLATCSGKAFVQRGTACFVKIGREAVFGWMLAP